MRRRPAPKPSSDRAFWIVFLLVVAGMVVAAYVFDLRPESVSAPRSDR